MSRRLASFKLPPDLIVAARTKAAAEGVTVTSVVEAALREWVGDDGIESARRWRRTPGEQRLLDKLVAAQSPPVIWNGGLHTPQ
jgi:hypothetical protein